MPDTDYDALSKAYPYLADKLAVLKQQEEAKKTPQKQPTIPVTGGRAPTPVASKVAEDMALDAKIKAAGGDVPDVVATAKPKQPVVDAVTGAAPMPTTPTKNNYDEELKRGFFDELYKQREALKANGLSMYGFDSSKATPEQLEKLVKDNPAMYSQYLTDRKVDIGIPKEVTPQVATPNEPQIKTPTDVPDVPEVAEAITPEVLKVAPEGDVAETPTEQVQTQALKETVGTDNKGQIDWDKVGQIAKDTGQTVLGVMQSAIAGWLAAKQGRALNFEEETMLGRGQKEKRSIAEEQRRLAAEQAAEERANIRQLARDEAQYNREKELLGLNQSFAEKMDDIKSERDAKIREAERLQNKEDRDIAIAQARQEAKDAIERIRVQGEESRKTESVKKIQALPNGSNPLGL